MLRRIRRVLAGWRPAVPPGECGAAVLLYHAIRDRQVDPWGLAVSPRHFEEHLELLSRSMRAITTRQLIGAMEEGAPLNGAVNVTFDDGYAHLLDEVRPRLERFGVPATAFIVSGAVGTGAEFWWDALARVLLDTPCLPGDLTLTLNNLQKRWTVGPLEATDGYRLWDSRARTSRQALYAALWRHLVGMHPESQREMVDTLLDWASQPRMARPSFRPLDTTELRALARDGLVEIGAHTVTHQRLSLLSDDEQRRELAGSRRFLQETLGTAVDYFSYPYGQPDCFSMTTIRLARKAGFSAAFANIPGVVSHRTDRYRIPRLYIEDCDGDQFARFLRTSVGVRIAS